MRRLAYWTGSPRFALLWATALLCALLGCVRSAAAQTTPASASLDDAHLVILELRLGSRVLSPGLIAFQHDQSVLLPLGALTDLLEFAIAVDPAAGRASGWFINETRRFELDLGAGTVVIAGVGSTCPPTRAAADLDDIYVDAALLAEWFPVRFDVRLNQLLAVLEAEEPLPLQSRLKREELRARQLAGTDSGERIPLHKTLYQMFTWPLIDANLEYRGRHPRMTPRFTLHTSGDLGGLETHTFLAHADGSRVVETARVRAGRTDAYGELLGPLRATRVEVGDLYAPSTPLVLRGQLGRGALLSNRPLRRPDRFDTTDLAGDGTPGWEVELYRNNALLDFSVVDESGRWLFERVPMIFGRNVLRVVLYGPQGQVREQVRTMNVGAGMIPRGQIEYRLFGVQNERSLVIQDRAFADSPDLGLWTGHAEAGFGLARSVSITGAYTRQPIEGEERSYLSLTADGMLGGYHVQAVGTNALEGGSAGSLALRGELFGRSVLAERQVYSDFLSGANPLFQQRTSESRLRLGGSALWSGRHVSYDCLVQSTGYTGHGITRQNQLQLRAATLVSGLQLSSRLDYRSSVSTAGSFDQVFLDQLVRGVWGPLLLRGSLHGRFSPSTALESVAGSVGWRPSRRVQLGAHLTRRFDDALPMSAGGSLSLLMNAFNLSLSAESGDGQNPYFSVALTTALTKIPESMHMHVQRSRMAAGYGATARVFLDRNANGYWDDQDDPLPEVHINGAGAWNEAVTGPNGIAYLAGLPAHREHDLTLDEGTLQDPFLLPSIETVRTTGHAGGHVVLEFPVTFSGDIEGTVYVRTETGDVPLRNIQLELVDLTQRSLRRTTSEFDGYYLFQEVPPGWYEVHILPESLERKGLRMSAPVAAQIPSEGGVSDRNDFVLRFADDRRASR